MQANFYTLHKMRLAEKWVRPFFLTLTHHTKPPGLSDCPATTRYADPAGFRGPNPTLPERICPPSYDSCHPFQSLSCQCHLSMATLTAHSTYMLAKVNLVDSTVIIAVTVTHEAPVRGPNPWPHTFSRAHLCAELQLMPPR